MGRLTVFAKGNLDVRDSLVLFRAGAEVQWNGLNEVLRSRFAGDTARVRHELWTRSDALLEASGEPPEGLVRQNPPLNAYNVHSQFSRAVFDGKSDVIVLSIQPDVMTNLGRHSVDDYLLYPNEFAQWPAADRAWFRSAFRPVPAMDCEQSMRNLEQIIGLIRRNSSAPILIYNMSSIVPGDTTHSHFAGSETLSTRIRRFNLALVELSQSTGISIIDVDALVARAGADALKIDVVHLEVGACSLMAHEVARVLADLGQLPVSDPSARAGVAR